jgi:putative hydrolase of the HAD superfamily
MDRSPPRPAAPGDAARAVAAPGRPALEAVLFDAGGTLVRLDFEWMSGCLAGLGIDADVAALRRAEVAGRRAYDARRGSGVSAPAAASADGAAEHDPDPYFSGMLQALGAGPATIAAALAAFRVRHLECGLWTRPVEGAREAVDALAAQGLALAVVSNSDGRAERHLADCGVREGLAFVVDSQVVGIEKPDPGIFRIALERLGVASTRALFVGDIVSLDVAGARAAGTHMVLIDPYGDYAPSGTAAIGSIAALPAWIHDQFILPAGPPPVDRPSP